MFLPRDVIRYDGESPRHFRVVWTDPTRVVLFDLDSPKTNLEQRLREDLYHDIDTGHAELVADHAFDRHVIPAALTNWQKVVRIRQLRIIEPLLEQSPEIFDYKKRGQVIAELDRKKVASAKTVHKALDRWWRRGMSLNALTPDSANCGRGRRIRQSTKLGRPPEEGMLPGININPEIEKIFHTALLRFYARNRKNSLVAAYKAMKDDFFVEKVIDEVTGETHHRTKPEFLETGYPSLRQFRYWYVQREDVLGIRRRRAGNSRYDKDMRGITGTAVAGLMGPGSRFEIDATKLEVECVSEIDRRTPIGRAVFYHVTDVFTKMVCGVYVGVEEPSWLAAGLAVRNVAQDKVKFCAEYGIDIKPEEWPCQDVMPARLMADRGEFDSYGATEFAAKSGVTVELASPYRGDQKGSTEKKFDQFHIELRARIDGMNEKKVKERGDVDHRRNAILTVSELTSAMISVALYLNNHHELVNYPKTREMVRDHVPPIPGHLWRWSQERGMTELRRAPVTHVEFAMLPVQNASVTAYGFKFQNLFYKPAGRSHDHLFDKARQDGVSSVPASYNPLRTNNIYLHDRSAEHGFVVLELTDRSTGYADASFAEVSALMKEAKIEQSHRQFSQTEGHKKMSSHLAETNKKAKAQRKGNLKPAELNNVADNRTEERKRERAARQTSVPVTTYAPTDSQKAAFEGPIAEPVRDQTDDLMGKYLEDDL